MGDMADYYLEQAMMQELDEGYFASSSVSSRDARRLTAHFNKDEWVTKDGDVIAIINMTDSHLHNCIAMLKRADDIRKAAFGFGEHWLVKLEKELERR